MDKKALEEFLKDGAERCLMDCLAAGVPWPESRGMIFRDAPETAGGPEGGGIRFRRTEPFIDAEREPARQLLSPEEVFGNIEEYIQNPKSGVRDGESRLTWYAACGKSGPGAVFNWADLRDHKTKILFQRQFWGAYHRADFNADQLLETFRCFDRVQQTFRRLKQVRWIKITVVQGRLRVHVFRDDLTGLGERPAPALEKSFFNGRRCIECGGLDPALWKDAPEHVKERIEFWRLEETGALTDEYLDAALRSEDEVLSAWAAGSLRKVSGPHTAEQIKKVITGESLNDVKAAVRTAGRLWLGDLEGDVMPQMGRWDNAAGPAVADFIGAIGLTGRSVLPKILRALSRRGDLATFLRTAKAFGSFPRTFEAAALPDTLALFLDMPPGDPESVLAKFPGLRFDFLASSDPRVPLHGFSLETARAAAVHAIIETLAQTSTDDVFARALPLFSLESPFFEKMLDEIEDSVRTEATESLVGMMENSARGGRVENTDAPISRRMVLVARALMRINKPDRRIPLLLRVLPLLAGRVGVYRRDSETRYSYHIENFASEPFIELKSILRGLPDPEAVANAILGVQTFSDKEKYLVWEMTRDS